MADELIEFFEKLNCDEQLTILEIAYQALKDEICYARIAEILDLADSELMPLLATLHDHMEGVK